VLHGTILVVSAARTMPVFWLVPSTRAEPGTGT
jgi:hypothetical protein